MRCFRFGVFACVAIFLLTGCAFIVKKEAFDSKTTQLFVKPCKELEKAERDIETPTPSKKKKGFFAKINPFNAVRTDPKEQAIKLRTTVNDCVVPDLARMIEAFKSIRETNEKNNILGDTRQQVRQKGFSIYNDETEKEQRQNTRALHGNDALAEVGMPVSPPPLQKPEEIKAYTEFMNSHYGEQYFERGLRRVVDRICINNEESLEIGSDYSFVIVWRGDYVFRRVVKGGPINNPKKESAFLLCPGGFIGDVIKGGAGRGINAVIP